MWFTSKNLTIRSSCKESFRYSFSGSWSCSFRTRSLSPRGGPRNGPAIISRHEGKNVPILVKNMQRKKQLKIWLTVTVEETTTVKKHVERVYHYGAVEVHPAIPSYSWPHLGSKTRNQPCSVKKILSWNWNYFQMNPNDSTLKLYEQVLLKKENSGVKKQETQGRFLWIVHSWQQSQQVRDPCHLHQVDLDHLGCWWGPVLGGAGGLRWRTSQIVSLG